MKKILVGSMALLMCLSFAGCSNNKTETTINNLSNELDRVTNTVSSFYTVPNKNYTLSNTTLSNLTSKKNNSTYLRLNNNSQNAQKNLEKQEKLKHTLLDKTSKIKNRLSKKIKLSSTKLSALKELTNNISKYNTTINMTKNEYNNTLRSLKSLKKAYVKNSEQISAKLNRLSCNKILIQTYVLMEIVITLKIITIIQFIITTIVLTEFVMIIIIIKLIITIITLIIIQTIITTKTQQTKT